MYAGVRSSPSTSPRPPPPLRPCFPSAFHATVRRLPSTTASWRMLTSIRSGSGSMPGRCYSGRMHHTRWCSADPERPATAPRLGERPPGRLCGPAPRPDDTSEGDGYAPDHRRARPVGHHAYAPGELRGSARISRALFQHTTCKAWGGAIGGTCIGRRYWRKGCDAASGKLRRFRGGSSRRDFSEGHYLPGHLPVDAKERLDRATTDRRSESVCTCRGFPDPLPRCAPTALLPLRGRHRRVRR